MSVRSIGDQTYPTPKTDVSDITGLGALATKNVVTDTELAQTAINSIFPNADISDIASGSAKPTDELIVYRSGSALRITIQSILDLLA